MITTRHSIPLFVLLLVLTTASLRSQSFLLYDLDPSNFPEIRARMVVLERDGTPIRNISASDLRITENGNPVSDIVVECPEVTPAKPISAVLVTDRSGSMNVMMSGGLTRLDLAKRGASDFVRMLAFVPPTAVAVTAFDRYPAIISDFRASVDPLLNAINSIAANGGTEYTPAFIDPLAGGIALLATRPDTVRRILIFLTDGEPSHDPAVSDIIDQATQNNVEVYAVAIARPMHPDLSTIAAATGGSAFGDVVTEEEIRAIYSLIALGSQGTTACTVRWKAAEGCSHGERRDVAATYRPRNVSTTAHYNAPKGSGTFLEIDPPSIWFGSVASSATVTRQLTITARNGDFNINSATSFDVGSPYSITDWGGTPPPFTLAKGTSRTITLQFAPADSALYTATLNFTADPCPASPVTLTGGIRRQSAPGALYLLSPVGGESLSGCDSVMIRWGGVSPTDTVIIEYSDDNGVTWKTITNAATSLAYSWRPPVSGTKYRIRISAPGNGQHIVATIAGGGLDPGAPLATQALLSSPTGVALWGDSLYIAESGGHVIRRVDLLTGRIATIAGNGSPGTADGRPATAGRLNGPQGLAISGDTLYIADYNNHRIRRLILGTSTLTTIAGTGQSGFGGDGGPANLALFQFPSYLAIRGTELYISDAGNNRIRLLDLETFKVTTVAGGGTGDVGTTGPATSIMLDNPQGIAVAGDRLFIAERGAQRIRQLNLKTGQLSTVAGYGLRGLGGDNGPATLALLSDPIGVAVYGSHLFITDTGTYRVRQVDLQSGIITTFAGTGTAGFSGDGNEALQARFDRPGQPAIANGIMYLPDVGNQRVRAITLGQFAGSDSTKTPFAVTVARVRVGVAVAAAGVDMGTYSIGASRDTVVFSAVCNRGDLPLVIDSVGIIGPNAGDFGVVSSGSTVPVMPGSCRELEFRFAPSGTGIRGAKAVIYGQCAGTDTIELRGMGKLPCGISTVDRINFGTIDAGTERDSIVEQTICNTGVAIMQGTVTLSPSNGSFSIISGGGAFTLKPNECHKVVLRFSARSVGRATAYLEYGTPLTCEPVGTLLFGEGVSEVMAVEAFPFPTLLCPKEAHDTLVLLHNNGLTPFAVTGTSLSQNNEGFSILSPIPTPASPRTILPGNADTIRVRFAPVSAGVKNALLTITSDAGTATVPLNGQRDSLRVAALNDPLVVSSSSGAFPRDSFVVVENTGSVAIEVTGGNLAGNDASRFELIPGQFPRTIAPGSRDTIRLRALAPAVAVASRAELRLMTTPTCDTGIVAIDLIIAGDLPELSAAPVIFRSIECGDEKTRDTLLVVRNIGGGALVIDNYRVEGDPNGEFLLTTALPVTILPGEKASLSLRFAPKSLGAKSVTLVLISNGVAQETRIAMSGQHDTVAYTVSDDFLSFQATTGGSDIRSVTVTNSGTVPLRWQPSTLASPFTLLSVNPPVTPPGGSSIITLRFDATVSGVFNDTVMVSENVCGSVWPLALKGVAGNPVRLTVSLPVDSALPGVQVALPIHAVPSDSLLFAATGVRKYTMTIRYNGLLLVPEGVTRGIIVARSYDPQTNTQVVTIQGDYSERSGDTLTSLIGTAMLAGRPSTTLSFVNVTLDVGGIAIDQQNGLFTVTGKCTDTRLRVVAAPKVIAVTPQPMRSQATVELELEEWVPLRATIVDGSGQEIMVVADATFNAGRQQLYVPVDQLAAGVYTLVIRTPYSQVAEQMVVVR